MTEQQPDLRESELDSWMTRAYEAEKRAWQAERRIARLEAQTDIRGRAVVMYRERAREEEAAVENWRKQYAQDIEYWIKETDTAEARIKAVRDELAQWDDAPEGSAMPVHGAADLIRRALESVTPPSA